MSSNEIFFMTRESNNYPRQLAQRLGKEAPVCLYYLGNPSLLENHITGFICSQYCPPSLIIKSTDIFKTLRKRDQTIAGGFHAPVEQEILQVLLRGTAPLIIIVARSIQGLRLKSEYRELLAHDRLLLLSPFETEIKRISKYNSQQRNRILAALADTLFIPYAHPGGKLEQLCFELSERQQIFYTLSSEYNQQLLAQGAKILEAG